MKSIAISRSRGLVREVVFLDGLVGTGKTMMGPILSTLRRVEIQRMDHIHEFVCALRFLERIEEDAAIALVRMYGDIAIYNTMIARESNFRFTDLSGVLRNHGGWKYIVRLFLRDGDAVPPRIDRERPILQIHSHQMLGIARPVFLAFGEGLRMIEMVRHPLHLIQGYYTWIERFAKDPRDFNIWVSYRDVELPWWASGWEERYLGSNGMDRVIYLLECLGGLRDATLSTGGDGIRARVLTIPFERFVVDPWIYLRRIEEFLGTTTTTATKRELRRQRVPRHLSSAGKDREIYRRYAWEPPAQGSSEAGELARRWKFAAREASKEGLATLERLSADYEARYLQSTAS